MSDDPQAITLLLERVGDGDKQAASELLPLVYKELRRLAGARMAKLPPGQTLQPTALVHDVYIDLVDKDDPGWKGRGHFFGAAAQAMRELLIDQARRKAALKRGGDRKRVDDAPDDVTPAFAQPVEDVLALDAALEELQREHPRKAKIVVMRYFAGFTNEQIAEAMDITVRTVERDWRFARAWLRRKLEGDGAG